MIHFEGNKNRAKGKLRVLRKVVEQICAEHKRAVDDLSVIFVDDEFLLQLNKQALNHDYYTDIITFDYTEDSNLMIGELYISIDRVRENADTFHVQFHVELARVVFHGVLHLLGYGDKTELEIKKMRRMENKYVNSYLKSFHVERHG